MSFSSSAKNELSRLPIENGSAAKSELAGILRLCGSVVFSRNVLLLKAQSENAAVARRIFSLVKELYSSSSEIQVKENRLKGNKKYTVVIQENARQIAEETGILIKNSFMTTARIYPPLITSRKKQLAYMRGLFLGGGSVVSPEKMYHLEFTVSTDTLAEDICSFLNKFNLNAKFVVKKNMSMVYIKEANKIAELLSLTGCHESRLTIEDVLIKKEIINNVNRAVNCETANLSKTLNAALRQIDDINYLKNTIGLEALPDNLRQIAELRLNNPPETTLVDLGEMLCPPIGKSGVNHRLKKIGEMAEQIRETKGD